MLSCLACLIPWHHPALLRILYNKSSLHSLLYWTIEQLDHWAKWSDITLCICNGCVHFIPLRQLQFTLYVIYVYSTKSIVWLQSDMKYIFGSSWNSLKGLVYSETYVGARLRPVHRWVDTTTGICHGWSVYQCTMRLSHCKVSIGQYTKMCTSPLIFFSSIISDDKYLRKIFDHFHFHCIFDHLSHEQS